VVSDLPAQPSLRRMRQFGIRPNRELGQNFLIDSNILDVIGRAAELNNDDVVLEVGGGLGVLSEYLADHTKHVHVVELDRRLEPPLRDALDAHANATLHLADAVKLDLGSLDPMPTKVVANLPYGVAATVILRTIEQLPHAQRWVAMVQKEVGERFAAQPGSSAYGVPSVLAQLACEVRVLRPV
jgi:16S rRNA (adenine1518-N6/adenine1519-N6)-dimethyltransferase